MIAVLGIGTEITTGQILNSNTQWLSQELLKKGRTVTHHLSVPDDRPMILAALKYLSQECNIIFVSGGLGPTADDLTRSMLAEFAGRDLLFDEASWQKLQAKMQSRGKQLREIHRHQCYFPQGAEVLHNEVGTADGFYLRLESLPLGQPLIQPSQVSIELLALPGPPKELQTMFTNEVVKVLNLQVHPTELWVQKIWKVQGLPESEVATLVNAQVTAVEAAQVGYRVYNPFVDVKLLYQQKDSDHFEQLATKIEKAIGRWVVEQS